MAPLNRFLLLLLAVPLLPACGTSQAAERGPKEIFRLDLEARPKTPIAEKPALVREWSGPDLRDLKPNRGSQVDYAKGELHLGADVRRLDLLTEDCGAFDRVVLEVRAKGGRVKLRFENEKGKQVAVSDGATDLPHVASRFQTVMIEVPSVLPHSEEVHAVVLQLAGCPEPPVIRSLRLLHSEPERWLPPAETPALVMMKTDGRLAMGLSSRMPLETTLTEEESRGALAFACGIPAYLEREGVRAKLVVTLADRDHADAWIERFDIPVGEWSSQTYWPPEEAQGRELELRFSIETRGTSSDGDDLVTCALSRPIVEGVSLHPSTVLLITSDTHRGDHIGMAPEHLAKTPFLDSLAARGVLFDDCQSEGNNTNPTHISIMTGLPIRDHGVIGNDASVGEGVTTLAERFAQSGYQTFAAVSAIHLTWSGCEQGFDRLSAPRGLQHDSRETIAVLDRWLEDSPHRSLFIWLHSFDPHTPYTPPDSFERMYWNEKKLRGPKPEGEHPSWGKDIEDLREVIARYKGEISYFDTQLEKLFEDWPRLNDATLAFIGDHGENMIHPTEKWSWSHRGLSRDTLHVPLLLTWPGAPEAVRVSRPVQQHDVGRTLLDLAGLPEVEFPGRNLVLLSRENPEEVGDIPLFAVGANALFASVRRGPWLLVQGLYTDKRIKGKRVPLHLVKLYDITKDPGCRNDLAPQNHELACEMRTLLVRWLEEADVEGWNKDGLRGDSETRKKLASLGYSSSSALPSDNPWINPTCTCEFCTRFPLIDD